jgi:hypothetical protein
MRVRIQTPADRLPAAGTRNVVVGCVDKTFQARSRQEARLCARTCGYAASRKMSRKT